MKILFIGPYRQTDEWGLNSISLLRSLGEIEGVDLTSRPLFLSSSSDVNRDNAFFELESKRHDSYDVLIQHTLPSLLVKSGAAKRNIAYLPVETGGNVAWLNSLNLMDDVFVASSAEREALLDSLDVPVSAIGGALPSSPENPTQIPSPTFRFYFFGETLESRSGVDLLLDAYLSEFHQNEKVTLIVNTNNPQLLEQKIGESSQRIGMYLQLPLSRYPEIIIAPHSEDNLHLNADCLVDPSYSLNFKPNVAIALCVGNCPIITEGTGMCDYVNDSNGYTIDSHEEYVRCPDRPLVDIFNANERWRIPHGLSLRKTMREAFQNKKSYAKKSKEGAMGAEMFSPQKQAQALKELLCLQ